MDNKFYVSLEAARLLKEKGYNEECDYCFYYDDYNDKWDFDYPHNLFDDEPMHYNNETIDDEMYSMPTKAEAIDWLESKGIVVDAHYYNEGYLPICRWGYLVHIFDNDSKEERIQIRSSTDNILFPTRLEAEEAVIIKALELLNRKEE